MIKTVKRVFRLFRQPNKIGETFDLNGVTYLVLGIQSYVLQGNILTILYTVQDLSQTDYISKAKAYAPSTPTHQVEFVARDKYDSEKFKRLQLGRLLLHQGETYKILEYTELQFIGTDMKLSFISCPVYPVDRKQAKSKLMNERRKKLKLEVF